MKIFYTEYRRDVNPQAAHRVSHVKLMDADGIAGQNNRTDKEFAIGIFSRNNLRPEMQ
jgi:hypothetical protein